MANNINVGPNAIVAKVAAAFTAAGLNSTNTGTIFKVGNPMLSWKPGRPINGVTAFEVNGGYYLDALQAFDLEAYVVPPIGGGPTEQLATPANLIPISNPDEAEIALTWNTVPNATSYTVSRADDFEFTTNVVANAYTGSAAAFTDTALTPLKIYYYRVVAKAAGYLDSEAGTIRGQAADDGPPNGFMQMQNPPAPVNMAQVTTGVFRSTNSDQLFNGYAVITKKLGPGIQGMISATKVDGNGEGAVIAFATTDSPIRFEAPTGQFNYDVGAFIFDGKLMRLDNHTAAVDTGQAMAIGDSFRIRRSGKQFLLERAASATPSTWVLVYTYTYESTDIEYAHISVDSNFNANYRLQNAMANQLVPYS